MATRRGVRQALQEETLWPNVMEHMARRANGQVDNW